MVDEELEETVARFLRRIGMENVVRPDMMTMIAKIKHNDSSFNYGRVPDDQMPDAEAQWSSDDRVVRIRESVFKGMQRGLPRDRMSVAHELGHYLLGHKGLLNRSINKTIREIAIARVRKQESEARRIAAVLLAPEPLVPEGATAEDIAARFGLSREAAAYRKEEVERIRRRRRGEHRPLPTVVKGYLAEGKRLGHPVRTPLDE